MRIFGIIRTMTYLVTTQFVFISFLETALTSNGETEYASAPEDVFEWRGVGFTHTVNANITRGRIRSVAGILAKRIKENFRSYTGRHMWRYRKLQVTFELKPGELNSDDSVTITVNIEAD